jgi:hypothetical protein
VHDCVSRCRIKIYIQHGLFVATLFNCSDKNPGGRQTKNSDAKEGVQVSSAAPPRVFFNPQPLLSALVVRAECVTVAVTLVPPRFHVREDLSRRDEEATKCNHVHVCNVESASKSLGILHTDYRRRCSTKLPLLNWAVRIPYSPIL